MKNETKAAVIMGIPLAIVGYAVAESILGKKEVTQPYTPPQKAEEQEVLIPWMDEVTGTTPYAPISPAPSGPSEVYVHQPVRVR